MAKKNYWQRQTADTEKQLKLRFQKYKPTKRWDPLKKMWRKK